MDKDKEFKDSIKKHMGEADEKMGKKIRASYDLEAMRRRAIVMLCETDNVFKLLDVCCKLGVGILKKGYKK